MKESTLVSGYIERELGSATAALSTAIESNEENQIQHILEALTSLRWVRRMQGENVSNPHVVDLIIYGYNVLCLNDPMRGIQYMDEAVKIDDRNPAVHNNYGFLYHTQRGDFESSIRHYKICLELDEKFEVAYMGIIDVLRILRRHNEELTWCETAVRNCPQSPELFNCLGLGLVHAGEWSNTRRTLAAFSKALELNPVDLTRAKVLVNTAKLYSDVGDFDVAVQLYVKARTFDPHNNAACQNILLNLHYYPDNLQVGFIEACESFGVSPRSGDLQHQVSLAHRAAMEQLFPRGEIQLALDRTTGKQTSKLRVGFVTYDLIGHVVSFFTKVFFDGRLGTTSDASGEVDIEVYVYSNNVYNKEELQEIKCQGYRSIQTLSTGACVELIRNDKVDVLIDLSGHTSGNRLDVFKGKPAATLLSYVGYPADVGLPGVRRISDSFSEKYSVKLHETPLLLPRLFLCYTPPVSDVVRRRGVNAPFTFGCYAKLQKINGTVVEVWKRILKQACNARLILKSRFFADKKVRTAWQSKFHPYQKRVVCLKATFTVEQHLSMFNLLDLHLDTFPYSGTTISTESLYMGVPVLTYCPEEKNTAHVQRVTGSILHSMGLDDQLITTTLDAYVERAVDLVSSVKELPDVATLFRETEISDQEGFIESFGAMLRSLR